MYFRVSFLLCAVASGLSILNARAADIVIFDPPVIVHEGQTDDHRVSGFMHSLYAVYNPRLFSTYEEWLSYLSIDEPGHKGRSVYDEGSLSYGRPTWSLLYALELDHPKGHFLLVSSVNDSRQEMPLQGGDLRNAMGSLRLFKWDEGKWKAVSVIEQLESELVGRYFTVYRSELDEWIAEGRVTPVDRLSRVETITVGDPPALAEVAQKPHSDQQESIRTYAESGGGSSRSTSNASEASTQDTDQPSVTEPSRAWFAIITVAACVAALFTLLRKGKRN